MASIHRENRNGQAYYRLQFYDKHNKRRSIRLGSIGKKDADAIRVKVEAMVSASVSRAPLDTPTSQWVAELGDDLAAKLANVELIERKQRATLSEFLTSYVEGRKTDAGDSTVTNFRQLQRSLEAFFGPERD